MYVCTSFNILDVDVDVDGTFTFGSYVSITATLVLSRVDCKYIKINDIKINLFFSRMAKS